MAACAPTPTLTLFSTSISTTILTTYTVSVQTLPDGSVSSATVPLIVTSIITIVNPTSTLFASCPSSTPISTITYPSPSSSSYIPTPTTTVYVVTSTPSPVVVYVPKTTTLADGEVDVITVTSTSTPPATVVYISTVITLSPTASPSKSSSNIVPIAGGAAGGFVFLIVIVATIWYILKKCRKPNTEREEEEVAFPFPVTRDRDQTRRLDLAKESRPYEYGVVGRSVPMSHSPPMASQSLTSASASEGRRDSATPLIGTSFGALTPMPSSGLMTSNGAQTGDVDVGRQRSQSSTHHQLPPGAAAPVAALDHYSQSGSGGGGGGGGSASGSSISAGPSGRRPLQVVNPRLSPTPAFGFFPENVPGSSSVPMAAPGSEKQRFEAALQDLSSSSGPVIVHSDGGRVQPHDHRPSGSSSGEVPQSNSIALPATPEPTEAPPAYAE